MSPATLVGLSAGSHSCLQGLKNWICHTAFLGKWMLVILKFRSECCDENKKRMLYRHITTHSVGRVWAGLWGVGGHVIRAVLLGKSGNKADGLWSVEPSSRPETLKQPVWSESGRLLWKSGELRSVVRLPEWKEMLISGLSAWLLVGAEHHS